MLILSGREFFLKFVPPPTTSSQFVLFSARIVFVGNQGSYFVGEEGEVHTTKFLDPK